MNNPYHKPAGTYTPIIDPTPVYKLTRQEKFKLLFSQWPVPTAKK